MKCCVCDKEILRGQKFQSPKYKSYYFCSEDCYEKFIRLKSAPKPPINFKPLPHTNRRKFSDYIQEWTNDRVNWPLIMKQAKDIQEEYELDWNDLYLVCKYARVYEGVEWDFNYGLGQIFPRYIQPCMEFREAINRAKSAEIPNENIVKITKKNYERKIEW